MSSKLSDFEDLSSWSWHWKTLVNFFLNLDYFSETKKIEERIKEIIFESDQKLWSSYRKDNSHEISYQSKSYQLAYLLRYYPLYEKPLEIIDSNLSNSLLDISNRNEKIHISIFGAGAAPESYGLCKIFFKQLLESKNKKNSRVKETKVFFRLFDKYPWETARKFTKECILKERKKEELIDEIKVFFKEHNNFNIQNFKSGLIKEKQHLIIFQNCLTEMASLLGDQIAANIIENISQTLTLDGKLILIERDHLSTPRKLFELLSTQNSMEILLENKMNVRTQENHEIPAFVKSAYNQNGIHISRYNKFTYSVYQRDISNIKNNIFKIEEEYPVYKNSFDHEGTFIDWEVCREINLKNQQLANYALPISEEEINLVQNLSTRLDSKALERFFQRKIESLKKIAAGKTKVSSIFFNGSKQKLRSQKLLIRYQKLD